MSKATKYLTQLQKQGWNVDGFATHIYPDNGADPATWHDMLIDVKVSQGALVQQYGFSF